MSTGFVVHLAFLPGVSEIDIFVSSVVISTGSQPDVARALQARIQGFLAGRLRLEFGKQFFQVSFQTR